MAEITFTVVGVPVPQGSMECTCVKGKPVVKHGNEKLGPWRTRVRAQALQRMYEHGLPVFDGAVEVHATFTLPRGTTVTRKHPAVAPDIDKLTRAILDAISTQPVPKSKVAKARASKYVQPRGPVLQDDAQVCGLHITKVYADADDPVGVVIRVVTLDDPQQQLRLQEGTPS